MSSFVISKRDYVRVAGIVAGVASVANSGVDNKLWIYSYEKGRNMIASDYLEKFVKCYELNVESVCKQYAAHKDEFSDPNTYKDDDSYMDDFNKYVAYAKKVMMSGNLSNGMFIDLYNLVQKIIKFSDSVLYQIEDESCGLVVREWFNTVIVKLIKLTKAYDDDDLQHWWGEFDLGL